MRTARHSLLQRELVPDVWISRMAGRSSYYAMWISHLATLPSDGTYTFGLLLSFCVCACTIVPSRRFAVHIGTNQSTHRQLDDWHHKSPIFVAAPSSVERFRMVHHTVVWNRLWYRIDPKPSLLVPVNVQSHGGISNEVLLHREDEPCSTVVIDDSTGSAVLSFVSASC